MKKIIAIILAVTLAAPAMLAQISDGQPSAKTIRTGNRPQKGTFGMYFGVTSDIFDAMAGGMSPMPLPIVNFKYMASNKLEIRAGIDPFSASEKVSGVNSSDVKFDNRNGESHFYIYPGFAYHFSPKNILDVYMGAEVPLGYASMRETSKSGDTWLKSNYGYFRAGLEAFVGLQAFVADLPLAIGLEYGISANGYIGDRTKITSFDGTNEVTKYETPDGSYTDMTKLSLCNGVLGNQIRLTISYYFK